MNTTPHMTDTARRVLNVMVLRYDLPVDGWEHYSTSMAEEGVGTFSYDRADGRSLIVRCTAEGYELDPRSILVAPRFADDAIVSEAKRLRVPMTHTPRDAEYLPVLVYRIEQEAKAAEKRAADLRALAARIQEQG